MQKYSVSVQTYDFQSVQRGKEIKDWGRNNSVSTPRAKHKLAVSSCFPKEPMNMSALMFIGLCGRYSSAIQRHVGLLLFCNFFLADQEKSLVGKVV
jgi:hypothetical protein